jgi:DNA-binding SARP family transcriptional activator
VAVLRVRLLGGLDLRLDGRPLRPLYSGRAESLLAYLLLHRAAPQPRQHVAFRLWPDSTEAQARTNLRHVLHNLRRALPDIDRFLDVGPRTLQWRPQEPVWLDVAVFEQAAGQDRLSEAVAAYGGDLLVGSYDEWVLDERERLAQLHLDVLERLVRRLEANGRHADALQYAQRLIRHDPLREDAHRAVIRLHAACGDRTSALRAYHVCVAVMRRELGVEPAPDTQAAYEALLHVAPRARQRQDAIGTVAGSALVGRAAEWTRLSRLWRSAVQGSAQLVLVTGEAGVGKSRLVEELRSGCAHGGAVTAEARAYAAEGTVAYGLVAAWLRSEAIAPRLRRLDALHLTELARLLPELLTELPDLPSPRPLPEDELRQRLFGGVAKALLAAGTPLLLVADDLQWSDAGSLQLIHYLLRTHADTPLLVAATARREELDARHPVATLLAALEGLGRRNEVALDRLGEDETAQLAAHVIGRPLTPTEAGRLYADSEGNPLFVMEALRADPDTRDRPGATSSPRVQAVIGARLAQLSEPAAALVGVAATIGRAFTTGVLGDASGADEAALVRGLDELWRRGIVREHGPDGYDFSHGQIRETAYRLLSPVQARHHHRRVARALQRSGTQDPDAISAQIAAHYELAGATHDAVEWYARAAAAAQRLHAHTDAARALERALLLASRWPAGDERDAVELRLLTALPAPLVVVEGYLSPRVTEVHERALDLARTLGEEPEPPLVRSLALATLSRGDFAAASGYGERLRDRAVRDGDDVLWVESAYVLGVAAFWQGLLSESEAEFTAALDRYSPDHRALHLLHYGQDPYVFCRLRLAYVRWLLGRTDQADRDCEDALAAAARAGHAFTESSTIAWAALLAIDQRDDDRLRHLLRLLDTRPGEQRGDLLARFIDALGGHVDVLDGRTATGLPRVRRAVEHARTAGASAPGVGAIHLRILLEACVAAGDPDAGLATADQALRQGGGTALWEAEIRRLRAGFLAALGAADEEVSDELARALHVAARQGARAFETRVLADRARLAARGAPSAGGTPAER